MDNYVDIIPLVEDQIPTILAYDIDKQEIIIGEEARKLGLAGRTKCYNFKPELWERNENQISNPPQSYSRGMRPYWVGTDKESIPKNRKLYNVIELTTEFLLRVFKNIGDFPEKIIIGEPSLEEKHRKNFRENIRLIFKQLTMGEPQFLPEPFAVFQYYTLIEHMFSKIDKSELFLVIDIGGGSFNSCIIKTTTEGLLSKGGASRLPLGLQAEKAGGNLVDEGLLDVIIEKSKTEHHIKWKENPKDRAMLSEIPVLMHIEEVKRGLSDKLKNKSLSDNCRNISLPIKLDQGVFHPEKELIINITGEDLKNVIQKIWRRKWSEILNETIAEATKKLNTEIPKIDKVIIAGGSSKLPFMKEIIRHFLPNEIKPDQIYFGNKVGRAVAYGIAAECREEAARNPELKTDKIATCMLVDLFFAMGEKRNGEYIIPRIKENGKLLQNGQLISAPFEIDDITKEYDGEFPFRVNGEFHFYFSSSPFKNKDKDSYLNPSCIRCSVPYTEGKITRKFRLKLEIDKNGTVIASFYLTFKEKNKGEHKLDGGTFKLSNLDIKEGESYVGIDFGTSNTYVTQFVSLKKPKAKSSTYPEYKISSETKNKLIKLETRINELRKDDLFSRELLIEHAKKERLLMVFHSNKLEGNPLTLGETARALTSNNGKLSEKPQLEAQNLDKAYYWVIDNSESYSQSPEMFVREINKLLLNRLCDKAGEYRTENVTLSGMEFEPPMFDSVGPYMQQLSEELKSDISGRSIVEFAAMMHTKFVSIHPFVDGNGRTARLFLNAILLAHKLPVLLINFDDRIRYLESLEAANGKNDISLFVELILECFDASIVELEKIKKNKDNESTASNRNEDLEKENGDMVVDEISVEKNTSTILEKNGNVHEDDPLEKLMSSITIPEESSHEKNLFDAWVNGFNLLAAEIHHIIEECNSQYSKKGFLITFKRYDTPSFEGYLDIVKEKKISKTWFGKIVVSNKKQSEEIVLLFDKSDCELLDKYENAKLVLHLKRSYNNSVIDFSNAPINVDEIAYSDGQILFVQDNKSLVYGEIKKNLRCIISKVIENYFLESKN